MTLPTWQFAARGGRMAAHSCIALTHTEAMNRRDRQGKSGENPIPVELCDELEQENGASPVVGESSAHRRACRRGLRLHQAA